MGAGRRDALRLCQCLVEATAALLAAAWQQQRSELKGVFVPLASSATERPVVMLLLTRLGALVSGDDDLCRFILPLLTDTLAGQTTGADAEVGWRLGWSWRVHWHGQHADTPHAPQWWSGVVWCIRLMSGEWPTKRCLVLFLMHSACLGSDPPTCRPMP